MKVTLREVAKEVGLSVTTVSRALNGHDDVAEETKNAVQAAADALGYTPNLIARRLQKQRLDMLGFIMPTYGPRFSDPFFSEFIAGIGTEAANHDFDLLVSTHAPDSVGERKAYQRAASGGWVDGLIVVRTRQNDDRIQLLSQRQFPFVAFGRTEDLDPEFPFVDEDGVAGMSQLVQHFIDLGHRNIGFICPPTNLMFSKYRLQGYHQTMAANGLTVYPEWVITGDMTQRGGVIAAEQLLTVQPGLTVIIGGNDLMAIGAMNYAQANGLVVGRDIAVGGFDDIPRSAVTNPPLTTVHQPVYDIGRRTCAILIDLILKRHVEERQLVLTPKLIVRASSGDPVTS